MRFWWRKVTRAPVSSLNWFEFCIRMVWFWVPWFFSDYGWPYTKLQEMRGICFLCGEKHPNGFYSKYAGRKICIKCHEEMLPRHPSSIGYWDQ